MKKKGFTLVELLVVIAIIAMLLAILMPALARVRILAYQMFCATNLSGLGKALLVYSNDNNERYPIAGPGSSIITEWGKPPVGGGSQWKWWNKDSLSLVTASPVKATISGSQYLLIKYADVGPGSFVCSAQGAEKFNLATYRTGYGIDETTYNTLDITMCWDFGPYPEKHISYSYHIPYCRYPVSTSSVATAPVMADLSPWIAQSATPGSPTVFVPEDGSKKTGPTLIDYSITTGTSAPTADEKKLGNSKSHGQEGQNVLFNDTHVRFCKDPIVGINNDNIYTVWQATTNPTASDQQKGRLPSSYITNAQCTTYFTSDQDAFMVQW